MLGYVLSEGRGKADALLAEVADRLMSAGWQIAGAVQINVDRDDGRPCEMDLHVLAGDRVIRISQNLGALAKGCRLDPAALEDAVGLVERALGGGARLLIVNKFGKQELDGRGFRPLIGRAMAEGTPVLTAVSADGAERFAEFAGGLGHALPLDAEAVLNWCRAVSPD